MMSNYIFLALFIIGFFLKLYELFTVNRKAHNKRERKLMIENCFLMLAIFFYLIVWYIEKMMQ